MNEYIFWKERLERFLLLRDAGAEAFLSNRATLVGPSDSDLKVFNTMSDFYRHPIATQTTKFAHVYAQVWDAFITRRSAQFFGPILSLLRRTDGTYLSLKEDSTLHEQVNSDLEKWVPLVEAIKDEFHVRYR